MSFFNDILPLLGTAGGFLIGGPMGAAAGGAIGGGISSAQNRGNPLLGAALGGASGYFGGTALQGLGAGAGAAASTAGQGALGAANTAAPEMGLLGQGGMYGTAAAANGAAPAASSMSGLLGTGGMYGSVPMDMSSFGGAGVFGGAPANGVTGAASSGAPLFSDGGSFLTNGTGGMDWSSIAQQAGKMAMNNQQQQQRQNVSMPLQHTALGRPTAQQNGQIGPQMPYARFIGAQNPSFSQFGGAYGGSV